MPLMMRFPFLSSLEPAVSLASRRLGIRACTGRQAQISTRQSSTAASKVEDHSNNASGKRLTLDTIRSSIVTMEYAVRGQVVVEADKIKNELANAAKSNGENKYPFDHIVYTNIGNPHSVGQMPLNWPRKVLSLVDLPRKDGVDNPNVLQLYPADAVERAIEMKDDLGGNGSGAYSHSQGAKMFRVDVATFIDERDGGVVSDPDSIFLTNGASQGISMILNALIANEKSGVLIPIPQYPLYSATIDLLGGQKVGYYLDEEQHWGLDMKELQRALDDAKADGIDVTTLVLINPGNPTGQVLTRENMHDVVKFCANNKIVLLADEVYQENVYDPDAEFVSAKRAAHETGLLEQNEIELVSFHSVSKGVWGECGRRGGYMELVGIDPAVKDQLYKLASSNLCACTDGQIMTSLMVRGPDKSSESYEIHENQKKTIIESLKKRSKIVSQGLDSIPGFSCQPAQGAMYCFPSIDMPPGAIKEAKQQNISPDTLYALSLLRKTGICVVPASGFGQREGRHGFRTTFLPSEEEMARAVDMIGKHYADFCKEFKE
ncbi:hypothetical protein MPSEU_000358900 [Mayamaea pseudoterrestris]|nr:hypothetical protein MPSEU_000358900 [Mayamaea pseudoterrestris]